MSSAEPVQPTVVTPAGNPVSAWAATLAAAPELPATRLAGRPGRRLVVVSAHPDDETIGAGRLIAEWALTLGPVVAVVLTEGEACLSHLGITVDGLGARRLREWRAAVVGLGATAWGCFGLRDGEVGADPTLLAGLLADECTPDDVLLAPWRHDPHPDHAAAGHAAATAARQSGADLLEYPVWMTFWTDPEILRRTLSRVVRVPVSEVAERARELSLAEYRTQSEPLRSDLTPVVPASMLEHHRSQLALLPMGAPRA